MSFLEELEKRKENLSMTREELALYAAKRQSLLTGLKGRMFPSSASSVWRRSGTKESALYFRASI